jgi:hypothetical protein
VLNSVMHPMRWCWSPVLLPCHIPADMHVPAGQEEHLVTLHKYINSFY